MSSGTQLGSLSAPAPNLEQHIPGAESLFPGGRSAWGEAGIEGENEEEQKVKEWREKP